jgi:aspartate/tyrosine/aromatic aminotransferase
MPEKLFPERGSAMKFGQKIKEEAQKLAGSGKDPNQIAGILCKKDPEGRNYGLGIISNGEGQPMHSSSVLLEHALNEVNGSTKGSYLNSATMMDDLTKAVMKWQRIPEKYVENFKLVIPSDAGTGAVHTGVEVGLMLNPNIKTIGVEQLGWPAYKAIAKVARVGWKEFPHDEAMDAKNILPLYQAGPMNTTGQVPSKDLNEKRAQAAAKKNLHVLLDRAYPGFEYARELKTQSFDLIMHRSFEQQLKPYIENGVSFSVAISPTKAFVTFAFRPAGMLLTYLPNPNHANKVVPILNTAIRARGSSFEHPITRAFVKAMVNDRERLEKEHQMSLWRLKESEDLWRELGKGTPMESLFTDDYAGLFRNPKSEKDADIHIYNEHLYPVFSGSRCRLNVTGLPTDKELAREHVGVFAKYCRN